MELINGWYFNFESMIAVRNEREVTLHVRANGDIGRQYKHELRPFFDPPEDNFNNHINTAYINHITEKNLLE